MARRKKLNEDQPDNAENADNADDTFGLPEIEYEPLKRDEVTPQAESVSEPVTTHDPEKTVYGREEVHNEYTTTYEDDDEPSSPWPKILGVLAILLVAGGAYWFFAKYQPQRKAEAERARQEQLAKEAEAKRAEDKRLADERYLAGAEQRRADSLANLQTKEGSIETLTERTRRYYVVVASAIDGDLIMDHAKLLSAKGVTLKIIPPFGKTKFYRLAIADGDTYADTQTKADGMKAEYGEDVWVVRY